MVKGEKGEGVEGLWGSSHSTKRSLHGSEDIGNVLMCANMVGSVDQKSTPEAVFKIVRKDNQTGILIDEFIIDTLLYKFIINCKIDVYSFRKEISGQ